MKNLSIEKREYRDGINKEGDKTGMDGWMDVAMVITLESY